MQDKSIYLLLKRAIKLKDNDNIEMTENEIKGKIEFFFEKEKIIEEEKAELLDMLQP